ncbi:MAG TPA: serine hydrolase domain-containing protein [Vicinamibacterales bacterium]|nr:serine hydrolase domain-containing protein [Vicinamibacterales bacterium]
MKRCSVTVLFIACVAHLTLTPPPISARTQAPSALSAALSDLDAQLAADFAKDGIGGVSVGVVSGAKLVWSKHYGYADMEAKRVATNDTAYRIGSITKQFTALAMLQLVEQGKMRLTDPLAKYVPEITQVQKKFDGTPPITLLQVATMHSGLSREPGCANHSVGPVSSWQKIVVDCLPMTTYANEPGTTYLYSNIGYASLGLAIERAGGQPFTDQVSQRILKPLGMGRSGWEPSAAIRQDLAHGYRRQNDKPDRSGPDRELEGRGYRVPNGALFSSVTDLAKFVAWELGDGPDGILPKAVQDANYGRAFFSSPMMTSGYGVGFMISRRSDTVMLGHGGSTAGYHASALAHRPSKLGVVVLRNCDSCPVDATPVSVRFLERIVAATRR